MIECPVCVDDHPTGAFTQTYHRLTHTSRECAYVACHAGVGAAHLRDPKTLRLLKAGKEHFERVGLPTVCPRCGFGVAPDADARDCPACGKWL